MRRLKPVVTALTREKTALAKRFSESSGIRAKIKRVLPKGEVCKVATWHYPVKKRATPQEFMDAIVETQLTQGFKGWTFYLSDGKSGTFSLLGHSIFIRIDFPAGFASKREVKTILKKNARSLMQKHPEIKWIKII